MLPVTKALLPSTALHLLPFLSTATRHLSTLIDSTTAAPPPTTDSVLYVLKKLQNHPRKALDFLNHATTHLGLQPHPSVHNLMLRILAHRDFIHEFRSFSKTFERFGLHIDAGTYFTVLVSLKKHNLPDDAAEIGRIYALLCSGGKGVVDAVDVINGANGEGIEERLDQLGLRLSDREVEKVLQDVKNRPVAALKFFRWAENKLGHKLGSSAYNEMLKVLTSAGTMQEFWAMVEEMKGEGHNIDIDTYIKLLRRFFQEKMLDDAVKLYEHMMDGPYKPATYDCGLLLRQISLVDPPDLSLVSRVVSKYEANGYSLSKVEFDGILRSLTRGGEFDEAEQVMSKMKTSGFEPDNITYSQMVFGLCKANRLEDALKILDDMEAAGCPPDVKTWTILIQGHCSTGKIDAALSCFKNMVEKNYQPDGELLDVIMRGLCHHGRIDDALSLFIEMLKMEGVKPRQATFKCLIERHLEERKLEEALRLLRTMKKHQFPPYADPFSPYISKFGTVEDAMDYLRVLNTKDHPSPSAYLYLFKAFFKEGRFLEAKDLLFKCPPHIRKHFHIAKLFGST